MAGKRQRDQRPRDDGRRLFSHRAAAHFLGVGRNNTLAQLIARGAIRPVTVAGREYIPRVQLEALAAHGEVAPARAARPKRRASKQSIRDIELVTR